MSIKPILITCQPDDNYFTWQNHVYIESCIKNGFTADRIHILLYNPPGRPQNPKWDELKTVYPDLNIFRYEDKGVNDFLGLYIPVLRPHILWQHFSKFPELSKEVIVYTDSDIVWTKPPDIEKFYDDKIQYMSDASSYMNASYFERKMKEVDPLRKGTLGKRDFLSEVCELVGISKNIVVQNDNNTGGVQYILKNMTAGFWKKVQTDVLLIRTHLLDVNRKFYKNENSGIQSWCADLWAVIFNLWYRGDTVKIVPELDFAWSSDNISKLNEVSILHNAGIVADTQGDIPVFNKSKYHNNTDPFKDPHIYKVFDDPKNTTLCNNHYLGEMLQVKYKYKLEYS